MIFASLCMVEAVASSNPIFAWLHTCMSFRVCVRGSGLIPCQEYMHVTVAVVVNPFLDFICHLPNIGLLDYCTYRS